AGDWGGGLERGAETGGGVGRGWRTEAVSAAERRPTSCRQTFGNRTHGVLAAGRESAGQRRRQPVGAVHGVENALPRAIERIPTRRCRHRLTPLDVANELQCRADELAFVARQRRTLRRACDVLRAAG